MEDKKLKDIALNFQANINNELLKENMELKKEIKAMQTQLKKSPEIFNKNSSTESMLTEDLISRRAAVSVANDFDATMVVRGLEKLPSVTPQKVGESVECRFGYSCSKCQFGSAKMEGNNGTTD